MAGFKTYIHTKGNPAKWMIIQVFLIPLVGGFSLATFFCTDCLANKDYGEFVEQGIFSSLFWSVLANGNDVVIYLIDQRWSWLDNPVRRLVISVSAMLVFTVLASLLIIYFIVAIYYGGDFIVYVSRAGIWTVLKVPLIITGLISIVLHGRSFLLAWRKEAVEVERLKNENLQAKLESLKNQVNPHFLFNSLNALTSLVYANQDGAVEFIEKLSDVYRYVLDHQHDELVPIEIELELVRSYVYLNKIRFGENLNVDLLDVGDDTIDWQVPPLTLQMLLENCFKHNEISKANNLTVEVVRKGSRIEVINNLNPINKAKRDSNNLGLGNIKSRYAYLTDEEVHIEHSVKSFKVSVPLLKTSVS